MVRGVNCACAPAGTPDAASARFPEPPLAVTVNWAKKPCRTDADPGSTRTATPVATSTVSDSVVDAVFPPDDVPVTVTPYVPPGADAAASTVNFAFDPVSTD